jgi:hypothetical protein
LASASYDVTAVRVWDVEAQRPVTVSEDTVSLLMGLSGVYLGRGGLVVLVGWDGFLWWIGLGSGGNYDGRVWGILWWRDMEDSWRWSNCHLC